MALALITALSGPIRLEFGDWQLFRNSSIIRPLLIGFVLLTVGGRLELTSRLIVFVFVLGIVPVSGYANTLARLTVENHPMRSLRDCLMRVRGEGGDAHRPGPALYADLHGRNFMHPVHYYFRRLRPWDQTDGVSDALMHNRLYGNSPRPVLMPEWRYREFARHLLANGPEVIEATSTPNMAQPSEDWIREQRAPVTLAQFYGASILLPGPYAICATEDAFDEP